MVRLASTPASGPAVSWSAPLAAPAFAPFAPLASAPVVASAGGGGGPSFGLCDAQAAIQKEAATRRAISVLCITVPPPPTRQRFLTHDSGVVTVGMDPRQAPAPRPAMLSGAGPSARRRRQWRAHPLVSRV